jgi:predicted tellurium resistance membrane protein TerC
MVAALIGLFTLTILEIVLGIDNIVFVSILSSRLKGEEQEKARRLGMWLAIGVRILLLLGIGFIVRATNPIFELSFLRPLFEAAKEKPEVITEAIGISIKDMVLFGGGLYLIYQSVKEIHHKLEGAEEAHKEGKPATFKKVLMGIIGINVIFSLDSVITAVGMVKEIWVMVTAVVISGIFMVYYSGVVSKFVDKHPTVKILALSFLVLIGANLLADAGGIHIPKGYTYFAMVFAVAVEAINIKVRGGSKPVQLYTDPLPDTSE